MDEQNEHYTKKIEIKKFIMIVILTIILSAILLFLGYGRLPIKPFIIGLSIVLPLMIISFIIGNKYKQKIMQNKSKVYYIYIILGSLMIIIGGSLIFIGEKTISEYTQIVVGFVMIYYGLKKRK